MTNKFRKLMREQIEKSLNNLQEFVYKQAPKTGWIRTIRNILGMLARCWQNG